MSTPVPIALIGPTASGKSRLAMVLAERWPVEIISLDSAQVYRGMDLGTAKPSLEDRRVVAHHLIDIIDPTESYSAARFRADALRLVDEITARNRMPLLVGGTMLYLKALREGLSVLPSADPVIRAAIEREAAARGWPALHAELARDDPITAQRLEPTDAQRIQRALEVIRLTGRPMSEAIGQEHRIRPAAVIAQLRIIALMPGDRARLHRAIAERFDVMLAAGLVEELAALRRAHRLRADLPSMRCVGYRQAWEFLEGAIDRPALREKGIAATRQLAKRQMTWIRAMPEAIVLDCFAADLTERARQSIERAVDERR